MDNDRTSDDRCRCGHARIQHIYEVGACRPGFVCEVGCSGFQDPDVIDRLRAECRHVEQGTEITILEAVEAIEQLRAQVQMLGGEPVA